MKLKSLLLCLCLFLFAYAQAQTWTGAVSVDWNTAGNWTPATVPTITSNVTIPNTVNKPRLQNDLTINGLTMSTGGGLDFNGFSLTVESGFDINGAALTNSNAGTDIVITSNGTSGSRYFRASTIGDNITLNLNGTGGFYEAFQGANTFNGNTIFNVAGTLFVYFSFDHRSSYNGNLTVTRTAVGATYLFDAGFAAITGNLSYTNASGGDTYINRNNLPAGLPPTIGGTVNISAGGAGNPVFTMRKIVNATTGGSVSVQNSGLVTVTNNTLLLTSFNVNGFTGGGLDDFIDNTITGNVSISDVAANTNSIYFRKNTFNGDFTFTQASSAFLYEAFQGANIFNGNTIFNLGGTGAAYLSYDSRSSYNGNLTINRTTAGDTYIFDNGFAALTGSFSYTNAVGGGTFINRSNLPAANTVAPTIGGTVTISATGAGNPSFEMRRIKNAVGGGSVSVQNSGLVTITNDTLLLTAFNVNGFTGGGTDDLNVNSITGTVNISEAAANTGAVYIRKNTFNGDFTFTQASSAILYEAFQGSNIFNGNTIFNLGGTGTAYLSYDSRSSYNGNLTVNRTVAGVTFLFEQGFEALTGNFSYTNGAGGASYINRIGLPAANVVAPTIGGTVTISATGAGNPSFEMRRIKNAVGGGSVSVQNSGLVTITRDTLLVASFDVNGFTGGGIDDFDANHITGAVNISDAASKTGAIYFRRNTIVGNTSYTQNGATVTYEAYVGGNTYNGNLLMARNAGTIFMAYDNPTFINGNLTLNAASGISYGNTMVFGGTSAATLEQLGSQTINFPTMRMLKTGSGSLTLNDPVFITNQLDFNGGNILSSSTNFLQFASGAMHTNASATSKVKGEVRKLGNSAFTFPVGWDASLNTVAMTAPASATDVFTAQYIVKNPTTDGYDTSLRASTLLRVSGCEYWMVNRAAGTSNVSLTFSFQPPCAGTASYINNPSDARITRWTGSLWENLGNGGSTGSTTGTVSTFAPVTSFSPFTFGSVNLMTVPLPVTLIRFAAVKDGNKTKLTWTTEAEVNLASYAVERSTTGSSFTTLTTERAANVPGVHNYTTGDALPARGINYYRLKMMDLDGKFRYSPIVKVDFSKAFTISHWPNPAKDAVWIQADGIITGVVFRDAVGRVVRQSAASPNNRYSLSGLSKGIYFLEVRTAQGVENIRLLIE